VFRAKLWRVIHPILPRRHTKIHEDSGTINSCLFVCLRGLFSKKKPWELGIHGLTSARNHGLRSVPTHGFSRCPVRFSLLRATGRLSEIKASPKIKVAKVKEPTDHPVLLVNNFVTSDTGYRLSKTVSIEKKYCLLTTIWIALGIGFDLQGCQFALNKVRTGIAARNFQRHLVLFLSFCVFTFLGIEPRNIPVSLFIEL
jgi:hypothetical protein